MTPRLLELLPFDAAPAEHPERTSLWAGVSGTGTVLWLRYVLHRTERWRLPAPRAAPARADRLWERTCFEAFLAPEGSSSYWEVNLAPTGDWNVYRFDGYRRGMSIEERVLAPVVQAAASPAGSLTLTATFDLFPLETIATTGLDVGLAAVLESSHDGTLSHWALRHAAGRPDFHRRESFVVRLAAEERA